MKKTHLKEKILKVLKEVPITRNCDIKLTVALWRKYYPNHLKFRQEDQQEYVSLRSLFDLPREDHIKRIRAVIQNIEHKYLPTDPSVRKKRKISEEEWRKASLNGFN